jgi:phosphate uptake regulator
VPATAALETIDENFKFLVMEVIQQLKDTRRVLVDRDEKKVSSVFSRDDYVDNLKSVIENKCYGVLASEDLQKSLINRLRGLNIATSNLERIADFAVNIVGQLKYLNDRETLAGFHPEPFFDLVDEALQRAIPASST